MTWPTVKLASLASDVPHAIVGGPFGSKLTSRDYIDDGVPVIRGSNMNGGRFLATQDFVYVSEAKVREDLSTNLAGPLDIVFTQRGTLGQVAIIPEDGPSDQYVVSQSQMKMTVNDLKADRLFVYYYFTSRAAIQRILNYVSSSGVPHINLSVLRDFDFPLPPLDVQRKIALILAAYDDLIENNRRRIQLLEQAARLLYKEWFVHLRIPGYEHVDLVESSLGMIPQGWRVVRLGEITTKIGSGATPRGGEAAYREYGVTLIRSMNVYDDHFEDYGLAYLDDRQAAGLANVTVEAEDILLNITGASVTRCCMLPGRHLPARVNQHVMIIRVVKGEIDPYFVLAAINSGQRKRQLLSYARKGGTREALTKTEVAGFEIVLPDESVRRQFSEFARHAGKQCELLAHQNAALQTARDFLLPRLMNGEIAV